MLLPSVVYIVVLVGLPLLLAIAFSFSDVTAGDPSFDWAGLSNYRKIFDDPVFWRSLRNTIIFTVGSMVLIVVFGKVLANILVADFHGKWIVRFLVLLPWTTPVALSAISWLWLLDSIFSPIDWMLRQVGLINGNMYWLGRPSLAMLSVIAVHAWRLIPLAAVIMMAGLVAIPKDIQEQAEVDGSRLLAPDVRDHDPADAAADRRGGVVRRDRDVHRHGRRLRTDARRPDKLDPGAVLVGVLPRHRRWRRRPGRRGRAVPVSVVACRGDSHLAGGPSDGGVMTAATVDASVDAHASVEALRRRAIRRHRLARVGLYLAAIAAALVCAGPFLWSLITAFKQRPDLYQRDNNPFFYNLPATRKHVVYLFQDTAFLTFVWNTLWVGVLVVAITLVLGLPAAYALARLDRPWSGPMAIAIFFVYLVPPTLLFLSLSRLVVAVHLQDNTWSLVLVYPTITIPVSVWLLVGFLKSIPKDIEEQAMVDGYSRLGAFVRAVVPLVFPGIVAVIVFTFTLTASEFIYALAFVAPTAEKVISTGVPTELVRGDVFFWQSLQAATVLVALPIAFVFNLFLDRFITGFTMGAVKG